MDKIEAMKSQTDVKTLSKRIQTITAENFHASIGMETTK